MEFISLSEPTTEQLLFYIIDTLFLYDDRAVAPFYSIIYIIPKAQRTHCAASLETTLRGIIYLS